MSKEKFYVVWSGVNPGIYTSWTDCQLQTKGYEGAKYKSFETREEAEKAFASSPYEYIKRSSPTVPAQKKDVNAPLPSSVVENSLAVDAACSGNIVAYTWLADKKYFISVRYMVQIISVSFLLSSTDLPY